MSDVPDYISGIEGAVLINDIPIAYSEFSVKQTRNSVTIKRGGKYSDINAPGKLGISGSITKCMINSEYMEMAFNSTSSTGTDAVLDDAMTFTGILEALAPSTINCITPSRIKLTVTNGAVTTGGPAHIVGTNATGVYISETIDIPTGALANTSFITNKAFSTVNAIVSSINTGSASIKVESVAGSTVTTVGMPKYFDLVGKVTKGSKQIIVSLPKCWLSGNSWNFSDADAPIEDKLDYQVYDPDNCIIQSI